jgi:Protein of unknown function (DUF2778)
LICAAVAALSVGFVVERGATHRIDAAGDGLWAAEVSPSGSIHPKSSLGSPFPDSRGVRVASLETGVPSEFLLEETQTRPEPAPRASFDQRFFFDRRSASFDERFSGAAALPDSARIETAQAEESASDVIPPTPDVADQADPAPAAGGSAPDLAPVTSSRGVAEKRRRIAYAPTDSASLSDAVSRAAIYDISAHTVYLPDGSRLEAHSGLGSRIDDPRHVAAKNKGPTPPNVYRLALRERLFHGVRAIRLLPVDDGKMYGRDGMLAHTYMLGPNGQSNGCVSFSNYSAFLGAFLRGDVDRLVVVERLAARPDPKTASGWLPKSIKDLFSRS